MARSWRILFRVGLGASLLLMGGLLTLFATVDFSGDAPEWWIWKNVAGESRSLLLAKEKIEWGREGPVPREVLSGPFNWVPGGGLKRWNRWIIQYEGQRFGATLRGKRLTAFTDTWTLNTGPLFLVSLIVPACWAIPRLIRKLRSPRPGVCVGCGYDLRATPLRCPECGREVDVGGGST